MDSKADLALGDLDFDAAEVSAEAGLLELFRGDADAAQVMSAAWKSGSPCLCCALHRP